MRHLSLNSKEKKILRGITLIGTSNHSIQKGMHSSAKSGSNIEFREYKIYSDGDDLKNIDWKVKAKTDKLFVKTFHEHVNVSGIILLDVSSSMGHSFFNEEKRIKFESAVEYAFILSQLYLLQGESLGLISFAKGIETNFKIKHTPNHYRQIHQYLQTVTPSEKKTDYHATMTEAIKGMPAHAKVTLISDLYLDPKEINKIQRLITAKKGQLDLIHIIDNKELNCHLNTNRSLLVDAESGKKLLFSSEMLKQYSHLVQKHCNEIKNLSKLSYLRVSPIISNAPVFKQFLQAMSN